VKKKKKRSLQETLEKFAADLRDAPGQLAEARRIATSQSYELREVRGCVLHNARLWQAVFFEVLLNGDPVFAGHLRDVLKWLRAAEDTRVFDNAVQ
jgi:hypothetical protein